MKKLALVMASVAGLGFTAPSFAMDNNAGHLQLAQAGVSVSIGERPAARERVIVRRDRGHHYGWRNHRAQGDRVVIVKKQKPAKKTVIIER